MKESLEDQQKQQIQSITNSRALFLTQDGYISPMKRKTQGIQISKPQQQQNGQFFQINKLCDILLEEVSQLRTQEVLSIYRQLNRNCSQNAIEKQGELNKLQKINKIDIQYLRKKIENEPQIDFNYFNQRIDSCQQEAVQIKELVQSYKERVDAIQKQFW